MRFLNRSNSGNPPSVIRVLPNSELQTLCIISDEDTLTYKHAYKQLIKTFDPVKFDPEQIAEIAAAAGTRILVFCTKHDDGFCFWDTQTTDYKIASHVCPYHTHANANVTRKLFDSFRKRGFWIGEYFSKADWNVPCYWAPQFGPPTSRKRQHQPGLLVVDRTAGGGCEDYLTPEGTHALPDHFMPEAWEACMTLGDCWGWTQGSNDHVTVVTDGWSWRARACWDTTDCGG